MLLIASILSTFLISTSWSQTCTNDGNSIRDVRFNDTTYSYCYNLPTTECTSSTDGTYIPLINETCDLLDVTADEVPHPILTSFDYRGSERCGCLTIFGGHLVIVIDANPNNVNNAEWKFRIINTLDWFYHFMLRRTGPAIEITYIFAHGSTFYETSTAEIYDDFFNITLNPYLKNGSVQPVTKPCSAINRGLEILNNVTGTNLHRWLFYWGFSTPDLTNCSAYRNGFAHVATYAIRQTLLADLSQIESLYGNFDECNWYITEETTPTQSEGIQDRAIVGTLSDFLCAKTLGLPVIVTTPPTPSPSPAPSPVPSPAPTPVPSPSPTETTYQPTWAQPSSEPTAKHWWSSNTWSSKHHKHHKHHHHHHH
jgi:hypothetical protein